MNKLITNGRILLLFLTATALHGYPQTDAAAGAILTQVSKTYQGYKTLQADFTITVQQPQQAGKYTESGTIYMQAASGKYRITTGGQELISDGKTQWAVLRDEEEVQVTTADHSSASISPANIFTFYQKGYKYVTAPSERAGNIQLHVVELAPENTHTPYFKIKLRINKATHLIHDVTIFDKSGARYSYTIKSTKGNVPIAANQFVFNPSDFPGMEIVDLR